MENIDELVKTFTCEKCRLPEDPELTDLLPFLFKRMKTKRLRKKFLKNHQKYWNLLPHAIYNEFLGKVLGRPLAQVVLSKLSQEGFARRVLQVSVVEESINGSEIDVKISGIE